MHEEYNSARDYIRRADYKEHMREEQKEEMKRIELKNNNVNSGAKGIIFFVSIPIVLISAAMILHDPMLKDMIKKIKHDKNQETYNVDNTDTWKVIQKTNIYESKDYRLEVLTVEDVNTKIQYTIFSNSKGGITVIENSNKEE